MDKRTYVASGIIQSINSVPKVVRYHRSYLGRGSEVPVLDVRVISR